MLNNRTSDLLTALETARTLDDLWSRTAAYLDDLGLTHSIYSFVDPSSPDTPRVWTSIPESWRARYAERQYHLKDPYYRYCCRTFAPIRTGPAYLKDHWFLTAPERRIILEGGETGFRSGFSAPVRLIGSGGFGGWNFGSGMKRPELEAFFKVHGSDLRLNAFCIHEHAERLTRQGEGARKTGGALTPREREVLLWLCRGLRTAAIADRLGIADVTVDLHFRGARRKLGAATREEALAKALLNGLIRP